MASSADYTIKVTSFNNGNTQNDINLSMGNGTFGGFYPYGTQPPLLDIPQQLNLVTDNQDPSRGPAWFFELPYDKLVILPEMMLSVPTSKRELKESLEARGGGHHSSDDFMRKGVAQVGDKPWFCYWNSTLLEGFVYVNLSSNSAILASASSATATPTSNFTPTQSASPSSAYGSGAPASTSGSSSGPSQQFYVPPQFPKVLKIEERRIPRGVSTVQPYCVQQVINPYGVATPFLDANGNQVKITINETVPPQVSQLNGRNSAFEELPLSHELETRQSSESCGCVWLWT